MLFVVSLELEFVMHGRFGNPRIIATEIGGQFDPARDKIVTPFKWVGMFKHLHEGSRFTNVAAHLASIIGKDERTGKRYLVGDHEPPGAVLLFITGEMFKREGD